MAANPVGNFTRQDTVNDLSANPFFANLIQAVFMPVINGSVQVIRNLLTLKGRNDYLYSNLSDPLVAPASVATVRSNPITVMKAGTYIPFTSPLGSAGYSLYLPDGVDFRDPNNNNADTRTMYGFTAFAAEDNTIAFYIAQMPV